MSDRVIAGPVARVAEQSRRRVRTPERRIAAHIDPGPPGGGLAFGYNRHRGVVAVQPFGRQNMVGDQIVQRPQRHRVRADLVGQGRQAEIDALPRVAVALDDMLKAIGEALPMEKKQRSSVAKETISRRPKTQSAVLVIQLPSPVARERSASSWPTDHRQEIGLA